MTTRDPHQPPDLPGYDPAQLSFGDVAAVPQLRVDRQGEGTGAADGSAMVAFREPPVCGESSYDDLDDAGPSWSVRIVQEAESSPASSRARPSTAPRSGASAPIGGGRPGTLWTMGANPKPPVSAPSAGDPPRVPAARTGAAPRVSNPQQSGEPAAGGLRSAPLAIPSASLDPLKRSTEMSPRDADAAIAYAHALDKLGNANAALAALDECLAHGGDEVRLICARAFLLGSGLKYDLAEAELRRASKLRADDPEVQLQTGILSCRRARWRDAVEPLQKAATQRPDDALAHFYLGEALNHVDQLAAALRAYETATQLDPANWRAFKGVGIALDRLGRPTDAAVAYRHMREAQGR